MHWKLIANATESTLAVIFETGDEVMSGLTRVAEECGLTASRFTAIGAFESAVLGYFDWNTKDYTRIPIDEQVEVLALIGDVALDEGRPKVHAHVVVGQRDGTTRGGHLLEARVRPTLEVIVTESPGHLRREYDRASGLALIKIGA